MANSDRGRKCVFFDRDGVLIEAVVKSGKPYPAPDVASMRIVGSAPSDVARLRAAGFLNIVVTNQPDVSRGAQAEAVVEEMHQALSAAVPVDAVLTCYHDNADRCDCRKPAAGLLLEAADKFGIDLNRSYLVGDRWRDIEAGRRAGCRTVLIDFNYDEKQVEPDVRVHSLREAVDWILSRSRAPDRWEASGN
jgi:D-glycero-D-manno-heptose 1,7-bisphosphate phosphatase